MQQHQYPNIYFVFAYVFIANASAARAAEHAGASSSDLDAAIAACTCLRDSSYTKPSFRFSSFFDRSVQLEQMAELARSNFEKRGDPDVNTHSFAVVTGASGIGKTRFGWEVSNLLKHSDFLQSLTKSAAGVKLKVITEYVFIDFSNGLHFTKYFDARNGPSVRLGVRLAAQGLLHKKFDHIIDGIDFSVYKNFRTFAVLERMISHVLESETDENAVVALVIHLDEFQMYVNDFGENAHEGRRAMKEMLKQIGEFMRVGMEKHRYHKRFFIVPVLTGTAAADINFFITEKFAEVRIPLSPLIQESGPKIFREAYRESHSEAELDRIARQAHFQIAVADSGYVPRLLCGLFARKPIDANTDWGQILLNVYTAASKKQDLLANLGGAESAMLIVHFALSAQEVKRGFDLPGGQTIGDLERGGHLFLRPVETDVSGSLFHVHMPFVQLAVINALLVSTGNGAFDRTLLTAPTMTSGWTWQKFENLHGHFQALRMKSLLAAQKARLTSAQLQLASAEAALTAGATKNVTWRELSANKTRCLNQMKAQTEQQSRGFALGELCRGALGSEATLSLRVVLDSGVDYKCFQEQKKWIRKTDDIAPLVDRVICKGVPDGVKLFTGTFLCAPNTAVFDGRFCLGIVGEMKPLLLVWQDKHSALDSKGTVSADFIHTWHHTATKALSAWCKIYKVVYLFLTNRLLTKEDTFVPSEDLLVVTQTQLTEYLSPTLAGRGLVPIDHWDDDE